MLVEGKGWASEVELPKACIEYGEGAGASSSGEGSKRRTELVLHGQRVSSWLSAWRISRKTHPCSRASMDLVMAATQSSRSASFWAW